MKIISDELLDTINGGVQSQAVQSKITLAQFRDLAKEAGLADASKAEIIFPMFNAAKNSIFKNLAADQLNSSVQNAEVHSIIISQLREFLATPAIAALLNNK